jgi:hypothetical protein
MFEDLELLDLRKRFGKEKLLLSFLGADFKDSVKIFKNGVFQDKLYLDTNASGFVGVVVLERKNKIDTVQCVFREDRNLVFLSDSTYCFIIIHRLEWKKEMVIDYRNVIGVDGH